MILKCLIILLSIIMLFNRLNPTSGFQLSTSDLCHMEGFSVIICTMSEFDIDIREPDDPIRLINGMIFKPLGLGPLMLGGRRVAVLGAKIKIKGREHIVYKLIIDFEPMPYDAMRIR